MGIMGHPKSLGGALMRPQQPSDKDILEEAGWTIECV